MPKYRWNSPHEWLEHKRRADEISDAEIVNAILDKLEMDILEDVFGHEMETDGYYEPVTLADEIIEQMSEDAREEWLEAHYADAQAHLTVCLGGLAALIGGSDPNPQAGMTPAERRDHPRALYWEIAGKLEDLGVTP